ncbi:hypothetical protein CVT24_013014 [Panaeolus cyanescens]|uniref:Dienelactone hydrolase domain-containing protein n=1 Tax=Panaeolus cyanescens TaxID=181874 RepID=A0A409VVP7_9AGAR|nr:hypothetical protein CVT24_013014 [Panaeolus cyanescens]
MTSNISDCCLKGFQWGDAAIVVIPDLFGWTFTNTRLLADHYADEADATVYVVDLFGGEVLSVEILLDLTRWGELDLPSWRQRNGPSVREPELLAFASQVRSMFKRVGAVGFCYGGWAVFALGAKDRNLVDFISTAHPTFLTKELMQNVAVPTQILAPEIDNQFTPELKAFANNTIPTLGVPYDYQYFPGLEHAFATRGNQKNPKEMRGMERAKNAVVNWAREWLHGDAV